MSDCLARQCCVEPCVSLSWGVVHRHLAIFKVQGFGLPPHLASAFAIERQFTTPLRDQKASCTVRIKMPAREGRRIDWSSMLDNPIAATGSTTAAIARRSAACDDWSAAFMKPIFMSPRTSPWRALRPVHEGLSACRDCLFRLLARRCKPCCPNWPTFTFARQLLSRTFECEDVPTCRRQVGATGHVRCAVRSQPLQACCSKGDGYWCLSQHTGCDP